MERQFKCYLKTRAYRLTVNVWTNDETQVESLALKRAAEVMRDIGRPDISGFEWVAARKYEIAGNVARSNEPQALFRSGRRSGIRSHFT